MYNNFQINNNVLLTRDSLQLKHQHPTFPLFEKTPVISMFSNTSSKTRYVEDLGFRYNITLLIRKVPIDEINNLWLPLNGKVIDFKLDIDESESIRMNTIVKPEKHDNKRNLYDAVFVEMEEFIPHFETEDRLYSTSPLQMQIDIDEEQPTEGKFFWAVDQDDGQGVRLLTKGDD